MIETINVLVALYAILCSGLLILCIRSRERALDERDEARRMVEELTKNSMRRKVSK